MKALRYTKIGSAPEVVEIEKPTPGPGEILLKVTAAGVCHSDDYVMSLPEEDYLAQQYPLPLTLGHEGAGVIESFGEGVETACRSVTRSPSTGRGAVATA